MTARRLIALATIVFSSVASGMLVTQKSHHNAVASDATGTPSELRGAFGVLISHDAPAAKAFEALQSNFLGERQYTPNEMSSSLRSLWSLLTAKRHSIDAFRQYDERLPKVEDIVYVWVDPTCDTCLRVLERTSRLERSDPAQRIEYLVRPSDDDVSVYAATFLELLRRRNSEEYVGALFGLAGGTPRSREEIDTFAAQFKDCRSPVSSDREFSLAREAVVRRRDKFPVRHLGPVVLFRGRTFEPSSTCLPGFDPLQNDVTFQSTIALIRAYDKVAKEVPREIRIRC